MSRLLSFDKKMMNLKNIKLDLGISYMPIFFDIETLGLNPSEDKIICIGLGDKAVFDKNEEVVISYFLDTVSEYSKRYNLVLVGYFNYSFDSPYIISRAIANGFNPSILKYVRQIDIHHIVSKYLYRSKYIGMNTLLKRLKIENDDEFTGSDVIWLYNAERYDDIKLHCLKDLKKLEEVYKQVKPLVDFEYFLRLGKDASRKVGIVDKIKL
uniref:Putative RNase_H superfamily protein n=1 Tax=viral metagenome TaxID=1070528 RepID=A0A6M3XLT4_9ZZZZ